MGILTACYWEVNFMDEFACASVCVSYIEYSLDMWLASHEVVYHTIIIVYSYSKCIRKRERKNIWPRTVHRNSVEEHALAVEKWESVKASTPSLTITSSLIISAYCHSSLPAASLERVAVSPDKLASQSYSVFCAITNYITALDYVILNCVKLYGTC